MAFTHEIWGARFTSEFSIMVLSWRSEVLSCYHMLAVWCNGQSIAAYEVYLAYGLSNNEPLRCVLTVLCFEASCLII